MCIYISYHVSFTHSLTHSKSSLEWIVLSFLIWVVDVVGYIYLLLSCCIHLVPRLQKVYLSVGLFCVCLFVRLFVHSSTRLMSGSGFSLLFFSFFFSVYVHTTNLLISFKTEQLIDDLCHLHFLFLFFRGGGRRSNM